MAEDAFRATRTVTFHALKVGLVIGSGPDVCGVVTVADIGLRGGDPELLLTEETDAPLPSRARTAHKWSAGSVLVVGGAPGMTGAAVLAGKAALGFGAGAVGLAVPDDAAEVAAAAAPELLHYSIEDLPGRYDVLLIGPGLGTDRADLAAKLLSNWEGPMVIDADALAAVGSDRASRRSGAVITPHGGEFERMTGQPPTYGAARDLATRIGATVLLKGNPTFVTDGGVPWVVNTGGPELATIGTGDVLAGMTAALLATGSDPVVAARSAALLAWKGRGRPGQDPGGDRVAPRRRNRSVPVRPSWVEVSLDAVRENVRTLAGVVAPAQVCAVVKADGYGHGDVPVAEAAAEAGATWLAVALLEEGVRLREAGIEGPILLLSEPPVADAREVVHWDLTPTVYRQEFLEALRGAGADRIQIKVDTGMHRVGVSPTELRPLVDSCRSEGIRVEALWTHFAVSEEVDEFTANQIKLFDEATAGLDVPVDPPRQYRRRHPLSGGSPRHGAGRNRHLRDPSRAEHPLEGASATGDENRLPRGIRPAACGR